MQCLNCSPLHLFWIDFDTVTIDFSITFQFALYSEGKGCVEAAAETGVPLEIIVLRIRDISKDPIRMGPARR